MKTRIASLFSAALYFYAAAVAGAEVSVDADYPGGNIVVERIQGDEIYVSQDLRGNGRWWFYWNFRVGGAAGRKLQVHFTNGDVIGLCGPAVSTDNGQNWAWLGAAAADGKSFTYQVPEKSDEVRFCLGIPYQEADLQTFLNRHENNPHLKVETLCETRKGRNVERLHLGRLEGSPRFRVALTCRHHACEMMSSWSLEGMLCAILADTDDGQWFRDNVEVLAIPFMDKDGVEDGDQGKGRKPHDHCRDYVGDAIYPSVRALKKYLPSWSDAKLRLTLDMHCPMHHDSHIYFVLNREEPYTRNTREFLRMLQDNQHGPLRYSGEYDKLWPAGWGDLERTNLGWSRTVTGVQVAAALEIPYAKNADVLITPDKARAFGADLVHAIRLYLDRSAN